MNWLSYSIIGACLSAVFSLSIKKGLYTVYPADFTSAYAIIATIILTIFNWYTGGSKYFKLEPWALVSGIFQAIAGICITFSFGTTPNPGLTMSVFRTQALLTAVLAYFFFGSSLSASKIFAMLFVIAGVHLVSKTRPERKLPFEPFQDDTVYQTLQPHAPTPIRKTDHIPPPIKKIKEKPSAWLILAIVAGITMSIKDVTAKRALLGKGHPPRLILWNALIAQSIVMFLYDRYNTGIFGIHDMYDKTHDGRITDRDLLLILFTGIIFLIYTTTVILATKLAPNVGYAKAIDTFGVIITTLGAHYMFKSPITKESIVGVLLIVGGLSYISFGK